MWRLIRIIRLVAIILAVSGFAFYVLSLADIYPQDQLVYGVTFAPKQAKDLGLDWQEVYNAAIQDLKIRKFRLSAYWDVIESEKGKYEWQENDWLLDQADKNNLSVILAVGGRLPRWPECHFPGWVKTADEESREQAELSYIKEVVNRYKDRKSITAWQIENEPFLPNFGECPQPDSELLDKEIALVRSLDSARPIVVTDSGELSLWVMAAKRADIFGTTLYRNTYSKALESYVHYPLTPTFFRIKKNLAELFAHPEDWIVIELQSEPWSSQSYQNVSETERDRTMSPNQFKEIIEYARLTGFKEFYLWGVEWWYWEKTKQNRPFFWDEARLIYSGKNIN